jgi:hypothetical protein
LSNEERWNIKLEEVKKYIDKNKKISSCNDKNDTIKQLGNWIKRQKNNYVKEEYIMKNKNVKSLWKIFIEDIKYKQYFLSNEEEWNIKLENVKKYIDDNKKRPLKYDKNNTIKQLCTWIGTQQNNYKKKQKIMKTANIRIMWKTFTEDIKYKQYFLSNEDEWHIKLDDVKKYIDDNKKRPSHTDKNNTIKQLGTWLSVQRQNYVKNKEIMKTENIRLIWKGFIEDIKYQQYFLSNEEEWNIKLDNVKKYIDDNKKRPLTHDKNNTIKQLGKWLSTQQNNYKKEKCIMKNENIKDKFKKFIEDIKYKQYFL